MSDWFDGLDDPKEDDTGVIPVVRDEQPAARAEPSPAAEESTSTAVKANSGKPVAWIALAVALAGLVGGSMAYLGNWMGSDGASNEDSVTAASSSTTETSTTASSSTAASGLDCPDQAEASLDSPEGAVVAFQTAYFAGDAEGLSKALAPSSGLSGETLASAAEKLVGADFCVDSTEKDSGIVDADTTVVTKDKQEYLLLQTITTTQVDGEWKVSAITSRPSATTS